MKQKSVLIGKRLWICQRIKKIFAIFSFVTKKRRKESRKRAKEKGISRYEGEKDGTGWKRNVKERNGGKIGGRKDLGNIRG